MVMQKIVLDTCELLDYVTPDNYWTEEEGNKKVEAIKERKGIAFMRAPIMRNLNQ